MQSLYLLLNDTLFKWSGIILNFKPVQVFIYIKNFAYTKLYVENIIDGIAKIAKTRFNLILRKEKLCTYILA